MIIILLSLFLLIITAIMYWFWHNTIELEDWAANSQISRNLSSDWMKQATIIFKAEDSFAWDIKIKVWPTSDDFFTIPNWSFSFVWTETWEDVYWIFVLDAVVPFIKVETENVTAWNIKARLSYTKQ